jgi:UDP-N-acetylglucosamine--dolichyl-phosphate N-acetylglucosaminephosphotransferase
MIAAAVYVLLLTFFAPLPYYSHFLPPTGVLASSKAGSSTAPDAGVAFPHHSLSTYLASLLSLLIATFLGFLDDLFDIRWRYKLPIPSISLCTLSADSAEPINLVIASIPLLVVYFAGHGVTDVVIPRVLGLRTLLNIEHTSGVLKLGEWTASAA